MKVGRIELYNDGIGFVEKHDFSMSNTSKEARIDAITKVASVCFNKEAKNKIALFDMLESESVGLPSSAFEFVPVLINKNEYDVMWSDIEDIHMNNEMFTLDMEKYGTWITDDEECYLLTNLRAVLNDQKKYIVIQNTIDFKTFFNTSPEEIQIIKDNFKVFYKKVPIFIARQLVRHRVSFQELSRRYTDDKSSPIKFYLNGDYPLESTPNRKSYPIKSVIRDICKECLITYSDLVKDGVKPEDARAVLPTAMYTNIWSAWLPSGYDNFIKLRTKKNAQSEIRDLANAMEGLK